MNRLCGVALSLLALCSCLVFQPQQVRDSYIDSEYKEVIKHAEILLDALTVQRGFDSQKLEGNAAYILRLLIEKRNQSLPNPRQSLLLHALVKEEDFQRDFQTRNTVTVELSIFDPPAEEAVALILYSETTKESIESYPYLHAVLRRSLRCLCR